MTPCSDESSESSHRHRGGVDLEHAAALQRAEQVTISSPIAQIPSDRACTSVIPLMLPPLFVARTNSKFDLSREGAHEALVCGAASENIVN